MLSAGFVLDNVPVTFKVIGALCCVSSLSLATLLAKLIFTFVKSVGNPLYPTKLADTNFPELSFNVATGKSVVSVGVIYTTRFPSESVSVFWNVTVGKSWSPFPAVPVASELSTFPVASVVNILTLTVVRSCTKRSFNVIVPVVESIVIGTFGPNAQRPLSCFVAVYITSLGVVSCVM